MNLERSLITLSHTGFTGDFEIHSNRDFWYAYQELWDRHWNAFGLSPFSKNLPQRIIAEINFDFEGKNKRIQGVLAEDTDTNSIVILHRGWFNVSKGGSTRSRFFEFSKRRGVLRQVEYKFVKNEASSRESALFVTDLESGSFVEDVASFLYEVNNYKMLVEHSPEL